MEYVCIYLLVLCRVVEDAHSFFGLWHISSFYFIILVYNIIQFVLSLVLIIRVEVNLWSQVSLLVGLFLINLHILFSQAHKRSIGLPIVKLIWVIQILDCVVLSGSSEARKLSLDDLIAADGIALDSCVESREEIVVFFHRLSIYDSF